MGFDAVKSEARNPKAERRPNSETRRNHSPPGHRSGVIRRAAACQPVLPNVPCCKLGLRALRTSHFELRISFGLRVSGFGLRPK
jgi:hypothetical protein